LLAGCHDATTHEQQWELLELLFRKAEPNWMYQAIEEFIANGHNVNGKKLYDTPLHILISRGFSQRMCYSTPLSVRVLYLVQKMLNDSVAPLDETVLSHENVTVAAYALFWKALLPRSENKEILRLVSNSKNFASDISYCTLCSEKVDITKELEVTCEFDMEVYRLRGTNGSVSIKGRKISCAKALHEPYNLTTQDKPFKLLWTNMR
jgi:hypothetical protein